MASSCSTCKGNKKKVWLGNSSVVSTLLIILIPKCPLCIMAYTSAITICGGPDMYFAENNWLSYVPLLLSAVVLLLLLLNRKGRVTYAGILLALAGTVLIVLTHQLWIDPMWYNAGTALMILAIWLNGSFSSFVLTIKRVMSKTIKAWQL